MGRIWAAHMWPICSPYVSDAVVWHHRFSSVRWLVRVWREFEGKEWQLSGLPGSSRYHTIHQVFALRRNFYAALAVCLFVFLLFFFFFFFFSCVWYLDEFSFPCTKSWCLLLDWRKVFWVVSLVFGWFWLVIECWCHFYHVCILKCTICQVYLQKVYAPRDVISAAGCSWHGTRVPDAHAIRTFLYAFGWKATRTWEETQKERMSSHCFGILMLLQFVCVRESHNENKVRDEQRARHKH